MGHDTGPETTALRLTVDGPVATLVIDRPEKRNAFCYEMWAALPGLVAAVEADDDVRVLVVRGTDTFSAGADISEFGARRRGVDAVRHYNEVVDAGVGAVARLPKPTLAAITGHCIGGGCELALSCDLRIAADDARFGIPPANLGIVYGLPSTKRLVDAVGAAWAKQILYTADILDAATALRIGLVNEIHPAGALDVRVAGLAARMAARAPITQRGAKEIVGRILDGQRTDDDGVRALYEESYVSAEYAEGVAAFLDKREPDFSAGRSRSAARRRSG